MSNSITLRCHRVDTQAAGVFAALRRLWVVTHSEKVEAEEVIREPVPAPKPEAAPRRKRQPGAPNLFDLQISARAGVENETPAASSPATAPLIAAAIVLLAFLLVGLRFWSESRAEPDSGLGFVAVDPRQQPVVQVGRSMLQHDRAGLSTDSIALEDLQLGPATPFDFFSNGEMLALQQEAPATMPEWLQPWLGVAPLPGAVLQRCTLDTMTCQRFQGDLGDIAFTIDRRTDQVYLADANTDMLRKFTASGELIAGQAMELTAPLHLRLQEGILYLTQGNSDAVTVLKPDDRDFGKQLDQISLTVENASQSGHIFPGDLAWLNGRWWTVMQSRDGGAAGVYLFTPRWKYESTLALPPDALPSALTRWSAKMLVSDRHLEKIYRFDATAQPEIEFSSEAIVQALGARESRLSLSRVLQVLILLILFVTAAGLFALGALQSLRRKVYIPPADSEEVGFDINSTEIEWLDPAPDSTKRLQLIGRCIAAGAALLLVGAFVAQFSIWTMIAISVSLAGLGGYYFALQKATGCHLGLLDGNLILVDHTNTYRVGSGPRIQYFHNYVMIDDVIIYLGNPLFSSFASEPLQEKFRPVVNTGIKVDRTTLQVKLIQSRHPMIIGLYSLALALACALALMLLS